MISLTINGTPQQLEVAADTPILWVLRDTLQMTGTRFGCGMALCGACTVHLDGNPIRSCATPVSYAAGKHITTIEAMENDAVGQRVQDAWMDEAVAQCGYCQCGQIMSAVALLKSNPKPTDKDITNAMNGNICRCGTYPRIRKAIHRAALYTEVKA
ncbi:MULTISPECIES: (2Fe-2S)-binding protein [unclassified Oceanobacter]|uniref:(2Fe-2S)-binding protein n=1 Tax=unclassified Oceanobacter TaxID=2620260 RepID=UPI0026E446E7|nr:MULTISPECIES: (2Fe-2S)-binding protein [unclassified Oceanobacter]MDO6680689.1 (2Fe-2S)-binding protein [Oceanobacter sp. 5_MG-2023]MDP2504457.1 (2Fe-2S)-binding protein [Oceanobacter sp. 3_MG-2023]MDP2547690.1 (2Fe-2S)-binding protein [Oceanobacter sp. 4_MG-2023]MDP2610409.1 (2Fe-2S)-binding protein [Oceanobacter sp. 1_MG-2023]MDP2613645.1 (2Fe-2S)-binding protein [Oceanobacter sp. 2_MG-2023]